MKDPRSIIITREKASLKAQYHVQEVHKNVKSTKKNSLQDLKPKKRIERSAKTPIKEE